MNDTMKLSEIIQSLETLAPLACQESYDNAGLITGNGDMIIKGILVCLDSTEKVLDEAISKHCNLIIVHHPIVFSGLKKITGKNYIERVLIKAIKNDIAIYAAHTNLDNMRMGVNQKIASKLGLKNTAVLQPAEGKLEKLVVYVPEDAHEKVRIALNNAGAGKIGHYDQCSFSTLGIGTFKPLEGSNPYSGEKDKIEFAKEMRLEVLVETWKRERVLSAMRNAHPYEEIAFDLIPLNNLHGYHGAGLVGSLEQPMTVPEFLNFLKTKMLTGAIRYTEPVGTGIQRVALCGGSGSFLLPHAIQNKADVFISADFKYHQFFDADGKIMIADIGHYESEQFTGELITAHLTEKFPKFAVRLSEINTNPINYF